MVNIQVLQNKNKTHKLSQNCYRFHFKSEFLGTELSLQAQRNALALRCFLFSLIMPFTLQL